MTEEQLHANVICKQTDELVCTLHGSSEQYLLDLFETHFGEYYCYLEFLDPKDSN